MTNITLSSRVFIIDVYQADFIARNYTVSIFKKNINVNTDETDKI